jgi:hypothetical protein
VNQNLNMSFVNVAEVQRESLAADDSIYVEDFRHCLHQWQRRWARKV